MTRRALVKQHHDGTKLGVDRGSRGVSLAHKLLSLLAHVEEGDGLKYAMKWTVYTTNVTYYFDQEKRIDGSVVGEHECDVKYRSHVSDTTFST
ncbi:hypothetical protein CY34DRAFT_797467 [Suillus luteus UH-Slu-Lm8-n1]|uniref:Uncharacterized protein n=1 Tax=Suillus luteus UH-Slu-Lm8-n1 TaxID=930992 RepID=A0A0D0B4V5_9AGAM|nr:hypothetical protein CY34DRAFT_797467 [Suillus luteus UH-Slu-Lm8-n1]